MGQPAQAAQDRRHSRQRLACLCVVCVVRVVCFESEGFLMSCLPDSHPTTKTVATNELHYSQAVKLLKVCQTKHGTPTRNDCITIPHGPHLMGVCVSSVSQPILVAKVIDAHKMDQALIFVRTRVDADCLEAYFNDLGGKEKGKKCTPPPTCARP